MEQSFNLKRSLLLFKLIFINEKPLLKRISYGFIGVMFFLIVFAGRIGSGPFNLIESMVVLTSFFMVVMLGFSFALKGYERYRDKSNVCTSHMLPASINEKFFIPFFTSFILIAGMSSVLFVMWSLLQLVQDGAYSPNIIITYMLLPFDYSIISLFGGLLFAHSLCCLFSVLFKNGALAVFMIILGLQQMIKIQILLWSRNDPESLPYVLSLPPSFWYCSMITVSLLFWIAAYTIFRKRQLNK